MGPANRRGPPPIGCGGPHILRHCWPSPGVGEIADGINAAWYLSEGDSVNAGLSSASMVPFLGDASTATKWAKALFKGSDEATSVADDLAKLAPEPVPKPVNGETSATALGRKMHQDWDYGPGFVPEYRLPSGARVDAINFETREVVELKPNNDRAIRLGQSQLDRYISELNQQFPGDTPWTGRIETYGG